MTILTADQLRALDQRTINELGLPAAILMETAGRAIAQLVQTRLGPAQGRWVTVLAGSGNNGGDGFVAARVLHNYGFRVEVFGAGDAQRMTAETQLHYLAMKRSGIETRWSKDPPKDQELQGIRRSLGRSAAIIDALVGIGPTEPLREPLLTFAAQLDGRYRALTVAADVPSGLCAQTGRVLGAAVKCHVCVTMGAAKAGLYLGQGPEHWQEMVVADIGIPAIWLSAQARQGTVLTPESMRSWLPDRPAHSYKGRFGHLLVVAGSPGRSGAALLSAHAGLRAGAGLVTLGTAGQLRGSLEGRIADLMVEAIGGGASEIKRIEKLLQGKSALAIGPGMGTGAAELDLLTQLLSLSTVPGVVDADGLTLLASKPEVAVPAAGRLVLTPHPGEMATLLQQPIATIEADRFAAAMSAAQRFGAVVVLKGSRTLVAAPDGRWGLCPTANSALSKAGSGDVLCGMIGGLLAQGLSPFEAACVGVTWHAAAGGHMRQAWGDRCGTASDLLTFLAQGLGDLQGQPSA